MMKTRSMMIPPSERYLRICDGIAQVEWNLMTE
jgi:hypothetical protein